MTTAVAPPPPAGDRPAQELPAAVAAAGMVGATTLPARRCVDGSPWDRVDVRAVSGSGPA